MRYFVIFLVQSLCIPSIFCMAVELYANKYPLHCAIYKNDHKAFKIALHNNADVNMADDGNKTPLYIAIIKNNMWFVDRLIQQQTLTIDSNTLDSIFWSIQVFPNNATSFHNLICALPNSTNIEFSSILYDTFNYIFNPVIQTNSEIAIRQSLEDLLNTTIINFNSFSYYRYPSIFKPITYTNYHKIFCNLYLSLIKAGYSLNDHDLHEKRPIDYAWQGKNSPIITAMLDTGSPLPSKINLKDIKNHLEPLDVEKLSGTKNQLMIQNTAHFIKNQQLGRQARSRYLRTNENARIRNQEFDNVVQELANIEID